MKSKTVEYDSHENQIKIKMHIEFVKSHKNIFFLFYLFILLIKCQYFIK